MQAVYANKFSAAEELSVRSTVFPNELPERSVVSWVGAVFFHLARKHVRPNVGAEGGVANNIAGITPVKPEAHRELVDEHLYQCGICKVSDWLGIGIENV